MPLQKLRIKKVGAIPTPPYDANTIYALQGETINTLGKHKGWRVTLFSSRGWNKTKKIRFRLSVEDAAIGVTAFWTAVDGGSIGTMTPEWLVLGTGTVPGASDVYFPAASGDGVGIVADSPVSLDEYFWERSDSYIGEHRLSYSDDTTDGTDGTWTDFKTIGQQTSNPPAYSSFLLLDNDKALRLLMSDAAGEYLTEIVSPENIQGLSSVLKKKYGHVLHVPTYADYLVSKPKTNRLVVIDDVSATPVYENGPVIKAHIEDSNKDYDFLPGTLTNTVQGDWQ